MNLFKQIISSKYTKLIYLLTSIFGFLILIPLYLTVQRFFGSPAAVFGYVLFFPFVVLAIIYFLFSLAFIFFSSRLSLRWSYTLTGFTTAFGLTHLLLLPIQASYNLVMINLKTDIGLVGLMFFIPVAVAVFIAPYQALIYGFIGYRLGRHEELAKQVEQGQLEIANLANESFSSILLDALGIFVLGLFVFGSLSTTIFGEFSRLESLTDSVLLSFLSKTFYISAIPTSAFLGFYIIRLAGHRLWNTSITNVSRRQTITAIILLFVMVIFPTGLKKYYNYAYQTRLEKSHQETSITNFVTNPYPGNNIKDTRLEISADIFMPLDDNYMIDAYLRNLTKSSNAGGGTSYETVLPVRQIDFSRNQQAVYKQDEGDSYVHLAAGTQKINFLIDFSELSGDQKISVQQRNSLKEAISDNSLALEVEIYTTRDNGKYFNERIFGDKYRITKESTDKLNLMKLLDEYH